jgi:Predicted nucleotidyltransferases
MDVSEPTRVVTPTLDGPVLTVLVRAQRELTGLEVHRLCARGSVDGVRRVLHRLVDQGIVRARPAGGALLFSLNRDHLAVPAISQLTELRGLLWGRLREVVGGWSLPPVHAAVFGSAARGDGDEGSDIDLLVVRRDDLDGEGPIWVDQLDDLRQRVRAWTGNDAQILELSERELRRARREPTLLGATAQEVPLTPGSLAELVSPRRSASGGGKR